MKACAGMFFLRLLDHKAKSCAPAPAEIAGEVCGIELDYDLAAHR
ncbi:MAG TPA: hypothetical protein VMS23_07115 [Terrimicrobiaceae bacterium]|nr:hypothetical protein [Terrimicrobiaceae bacterium]